LDGIRIPEILRLEKPAEKEILEDRMRWIVINGARIG
jgi:hypothetical protein